MQGCLGFKNYVEASRNTPQQLYNPRLLVVYLIEEGGFLLRLQLQLLAHHAPAHDTRSALAPLHIRRNRLRASRPYTRPSTSAKPLLQHRDPCDREAVTAMAVRCPRANREMYYVRDRRRADKRGRVDTAGDLE